MIKPALAASIIIMASTSSAISAACRLSLDDCETIAREDRLLLVEEIRDRNDLAGMLPYPRDMEVAQRRNDRMRARLPRLPKHIAQEWVRLSLCRAKDKLAALDGEKNNSRECM